MNEDNERFSNCCRQNYAENIFFKWCLNLILASSPSYSWIKLLWNWLTSHLQKDPCKQQRVFVYFFIFLFIWNVAILLRFILVSKKKEKKKKICKNIKQEILFTSESLLICAYKTQKDLLTSLWSKRLAKKIMQQVFNREAVTILATKKRNGRDVSVC